MCYRPITLRNPATGEFMQVPCGKCLDCLRKYQNAWSNRMYEEFKSKGFKGVFFTLTYNEERVPKNYFVDGEIYRSYPDYGFGNVVSVRTSYAAPSAPRGVRKKYASTVHSVLADNHILRDDLFEPNQNILDFNVQRGPKKYQEFKGHLQKLFAEYFAMTHRPFKLTLPEKDVVTETLVTQLDEFLDFDPAHLWKCNEDTGELTPALTYEKPLADIFEFRERPIVSFNSVRKEDVQLWIRRNRTRSKRKDSNFDFSYFITSEYGPRTLRPHYHGVFFGVTKEQVKDWFKDWQLHYGEIVTFDNLDPSKGGLSYVSKYCSKGSFEHPLCARDFFYFRRPANTLHDVRVSEYHSKHFEKCIQWFGVDMPLVDCTFHLCSKGLGVDWTKGDPIRCTEFEEVDAMPEKPVYDIEYFGSPDFDLNKIIADYDSYQERKLSLEKWLRLFSHRCCYERRFKTKEGEKVFAFALPSYYRQKMFSDNLRHTLANFLQSENDRLYREKLGKVESNFLSGEDVEKVLALEKEEQQKVIDSFNSRFQKFKEFYGKSKL